MVNVQPCERAAQAAPFAIAGNHGATFGGRDRVRESPRESVAEIEDLGVDLGSGNFSTRDLDLAVACDTCCTFARRAIVDDDLITRSVDRRSHRSACELGDGRSERHGLATLFPQVTNRVVEIDGVLRREIERYARVRRLATLSRD